MFGVIKNMFIAFLANIVNAFNNIKCVSLKNQKCEIQPALINLHYFPFAVKLDRCVGSCNTHNTYPIKYVFQIKQKIKTYMFLI